MLFLVHQHHAKSSSDSSIFFKRKCYTEFEFFRNNSNLIFISVWIFIWCWCSCSKWEIRLSGKYVHRPKMLMFLMKTPKAQEIISFYSPLVLSSISTKYFFFLSRQWNKLDDSLRNSSSSSLHSLHNKSKHIDLLSFLVVKLILSGHVTPEEIKATIVMS